MTSLLRVAVAALFLLVLTAGAWAEEEGLSYETHLTKAGSGIAFVREPADYTRFYPPLKTLPAYDPAQAGNPFQVDLRSRDLTALDLSGRLDDLRHANWDSKTKWPAKLPGGFDPARIMESAKNPGLGVRALHAKGITGKGVSIAIVDQPLLTTHVEYKDRIRLYEEIHAGPETSMHGPAVSSLAVGKTVGVAPDADLYYIGMHHIVGRDEKGEAKLDFSIVAQGIDRLLEINRSLPRERKIRVISMSLGWMPGMTGVDKLNEAIARATKEGVFVLSVSVELTHKLSFAGLERDMLTDPEVPTSYRGSGMAPYLDQPGAKPALWVPMYSRATASPTGPTDYAFYGPGGASWTIPYLAGLYALACQVKPEVTPEEFWRKAIETGDVVEVQTTRLPDPEARVAKEAASQADAALARSKQAAQGKDVDVYLAELYTKRTGLRKDRMSEAEFRAWVIDLMTTWQLGDGKRHKLGNIANPARLMGALNK